MGSIDFAGTVAKEKKCKAQQEEPGIIIIFNSINKLIKLTFNHQAEINTIQVNYRIGVKG
jgi:hypothetical protein